MAMLTGVQEIDQGTLMQMMRFSIRRGSNLMTFGPAGIGKTEMAEQAAAAEGYDFIYLNLSVLEAPDLLGLPRIGENGKTAYAIPEKFPYDGEGKPKVLLVDELDKARPELQNPMLELFQFRSVNGTRLNIHSVLATGNLPDENSFSQPVSHALMNRCSVFRTTCSFDPWQDWAAGRVNALVVGFLSRSPHMLLQPPPEGDDTAYCHPSPRSWTLAGKDLDGTTAQDSVDFQTLLVAGRVGQGPATKFKVWLDHYRHISPQIDALVRDGKHPSPDAVNSLDRVMVCAIAGADAIMESTRRADAATKDREGAVKAVHKVTENVMGWMNTISSEMAIGAVKSVLHMEAITKYQLMKVKPFMEVYVKIRKAMNRED